MNRHRRIRFAFGMLLVLTAALAAVAAQGCSGGSNPAEPGSPVVMTSAIIEVNGETVNGMTVTRGHGEGSSTRFEAELSDGVRALAGGSAQVRYERPGPGMMGGSGTFMLYDDGTHGDRVPNDGRYCYEDWAGDYGCHRTAAPTGEYRYEFWGMDGREHHSNHMMVTVTVR